MLNLASIIVFKITYITKFLYCAAFSTTQSVGLNRTTFVFFKWFNKAQMRKFSKLTFIHKKRAIFQSHRNWFRIIR